MSIPQVVLKARRAQPFFGRHPWVFAGAVERIEGSPGDGDEVDLVTSTGNFVARGLFNSKSKILVRLFSWEPSRALDESFFRERIESAVRLRRDILRLVNAGQACRLIFSEADGLSGLTADFYGEFVCMQFTALGLGLRREMLGQIVKDLTQARGIILRTEKGVGKLEGIELQDGLLIGEEPTGPVIVDDGSGLKVQVNLTEGQKTGFYLDQRDNRVAASRYAKGRRILDAFCYSGGFGIHAAKAGAASVECVDGSAAALELAKANAELNGVSGLKFVEADVFDHMAELAKDNQKFGMIVLDPPKFARARHSIPEAIQGYRRLHSLALRLLKPDGILVTCCCSGLIEVGMIEELLSQVAAREKRDLQILERRGAAADHPVAVSCLETGYLKCFISRVI